MVELSARLNRTRQSSSPAALAPPLAPPKNHMLGIILASPPSMPDGKIDLRWLAGSNRSNAVPELLGMLVPCAKLVADLAILEKSGKAII